MKRTTEKHPSNTSAKPAENERITKFKIFAEMTSSSFFIVLGTRIIYANPAMEALCGYSKKELGQINYFDLFPAENKTVLPDWIREIESGRIKSHQGELKIISKNGEEKWIDLNVAMIDYDGIQAAFTTAFDITERKRAETLQEAVYRIAQAADRSKRLDDLFPAVHRIISEVMPANNFYISLIDTEHDLLTFPYTCDDFEPQVAPQKPGKGLTEYVMRSGKSLLCTLEKHKELEAAGEVELVGTQSPIWLGVPLIIDQNVIGAMVVQDYQSPLAYGIREQRILEFVSSQVAMAINRKRAEDTLWENEERLRRRADELAALYKTTRDLSSPSDSKTLLQTIIDRASMLLNSAGGFMFLRSNESNELELVVAHGNQELIGLRVNQGEGLAGLVAQKLEPLALADYRSWENRSEKFDAVPITALVAVPMIYGEKPLGVLTVFELNEDNKIPVRTYTNSDIEQLSFFAGSAAIAVHNTQLYEETKQRLVELELLYQASLSSVQIHSLKAVAQKIVDSLEDLLNWRASIWLVDDKRPVLLAYSPGGLTDYTMGEVIDRSGEVITSFETGIIGWVCKHGRSQRLGDVRKNPHYVAVRQDVNSELCVPLKIGGKTIGCINVESPVKDTFGEHDERLMNTLANQAAVSIENARLFEETRHQALRQVALNEIISASARVGTTLDEILNIALEQTLQTLDLNMGAIWISWSPRSIHRIAARGLPPTVNAMLANSALAGGMMKTRTLAVNDWSHVKHEFAETFQRVGINSTIIVPLLLNERCVGGLVVAALAPTRWSKEEIALMEAIGREVGVAAERARLFGETTNRINELEVVNKISTSLRMAQNLDAMLPQLLNETLKALDAETGGIWLFDLKKDRLCLKTARGWCAKADQLEIPKGENLLGTVMTTGDVYYSIDIADDRQTNEEFRKMALPDWSAICVPISKENETIGLFLVCAEAPRDFTGEDGRLLVTLSEIAGNAITRMRLNEQTLQHAAELERRVAERTAELQAALLKAQTADRLKSEFIANVNHELRTPLTNLILYYQMLQSHPDVKRGERLEVIGRELQRLRGLIEELLTLSRLDLGKVTFHTQRHDLGKIIQTLVNDRKALAETHGLTLVTQLEPEIKPFILDEPTMVQAISNLLTNALNYTPAGGKVIIRTIKKGLEGSVDFEAGFSVEDDGPGINEEELPQLFERFYRGSVGRQSGAPGTGLGLAIVKQVVEFHHGHIEVGRGAGGKGALFTVWIPAQT
jgi:PAS domain S-box-containing protein